MNETTKHIGVIGAGSWGTALAATCARAGHNVTLWCRNEDLASAMRDTGENTVYLPGIKLPDNIAVTTAKQDLARSDAILIVTPAQAMRTVLNDFADILPAGIPARHLLQGHRGRNRRLHEQCAGRNLPAPHPRRPVRPELCRRRGPRPSNRRHPGG